VSLQWIISFEILFSVLKHPVLMYHELYDEFVSLSLHGIFTISQLSSANSRVSLKTYRVEYRSNLCTALSKLWTVTPTDL